MVYAGKIIKDLGLEDEYTLLVTVLCRKKTATVCAGKYIIEQSGIRPEFVVSKTEPTDCRIPWSTRSWLEIRIDVQGVMPRFGTRTW